MLTQGEDVEAHALAGRGWTISSIARHLGRDRKTVRAYVAGQRSPGVRRRPAPDPIEPFVDYLRARFGDDPHLWLSALFDEVVPLGYPRSYPSFVRAVRRQALRPHCERCRGVKGRATIEIEHPPGDELQWDWFERRRAPWGGTPYVLLTGPRTELATIAVHLVISAVSFALLAFLVSRATGHQLIARPGTSTAPEALP
jgi:hypothetical protein